MSNLPKVPKAGLTQSRECLPTIVAAILETKTVALDLETYDQRKGDRLDPWAGDIRLLSLRVQGQDSACAWLRLGELKSAF